MTDDGKLTHVNGDQLREVSTEEWLRGYFAGEEENTLKNACLRLLDEGKGLREDVVYAENAYDELKQRHSDLKAEYESACITSDKYHDWVKEILKLVREEPPELTAWSHHDIVERVSIKIQDLENRLNVKELENAGLRDLALRAEKIIFAKHDQKNELYRQLESGELKKRLQWFGNTFDPLGRIQWLLDTRERVHTEGQVDE